MIKVGCDRRGLQALCRELSATQPQDAGCHRTAPGAVRHKGCRAAPARQDKHLGRSGTDRHPCDGYSVRLKALLKNNLNTIMLQSLNGEVSPIPDSHTSSVLYRKYLTRSMTGRAGSPLPAATTIERNCVGRALRLARGASPTSGNLFRFRYTRDVRIGFYRSAVERR